MKQHDQFEELCVAVVAGFASAEDMRDLENHLHTCEDCRQRLRDFAQIGAGILAASNGDAWRAPRGMTARFVARAVGEGIPLREPTRILPWASHHPAVWGGTIAAAAVLLLFVFGNRQRIDGLSHHQKSAAVANNFSSATTAGMTTAVSATPGDATKQLKEELDTTIADKQRLAGTVSHLNDQIRTGTAHQRNIAAQIAMLQSQLDQLRQEVSAKDSQIAELSRQLRHGETVNVDQAASIAESQIQLHALREKLAERDATIHEEQQLLAAGSQARDLIIARNLHIIDVHDHNGKGERQKAFGRIFYTEGKQIVFYAYDLDSATKLKKQDGFYVWGGKLGDGRTAKNLGIFRNEDAEAGRWVMTFDDPHVLAQINTVFVTAESKKNVERPHGKQILFAYLGDRANHP